VILFIQAFEESRDEIPMTTRWDHVHQRWVGRPEPRPDSSPLITPDVLEQTHHQSPPQSSVELSQPKLHTAIFAASLPP